ncbi:unnamed protein product [Symbiodinium sp. CCMP2456]|nr:unnamed protein product [Symbiodinium sp. CCMP2456]
MPLELGFDAWAWPAAVLGQGVVVALVVAAGLVAWQLSAMLLLFCIIISLGMVANLDTSRKQFGTFLWILICGQFFSLATLFSAHALAEAQDATQIWPEADSELVPLLPEMADALDWVSQSDSFVDSYIFHDVLLFNSHASGVKGLMATNLSEASFVSEEVRPGDISAARGYTEFEGKLFFAAATAGGDELWFWDGSDALNASIRPVQSFSNRLSLRNFRVHGSSLYIKVSWLVCGSWNPGVLRLQNDSVALVGGSLSCSRPSQGCLIGELCLALVPLAALSTLLLRSFPGLCVILFSSLYGVIVVVRLLLVPELEELREFLLTSFAAYSSVGYALVVLLHLCGRDTEWTEDLKRWSTVLVSVSFCAAAQLRLDIPEAVEAWRWAVFAICGVALQLLGVVGRRRLPMVVGHLVLMLVLGKLALEVLEHLTPMRNAGLAAQRAIQLASLAVLFGAVPSPDSVPYKRTENIRSVHPAPGKEAVRGGREGAREAGEQETKRWPKCCWARRADFCAGACQGCFRIPSMNNRWRQTRDQPPITPRTHNGWGGQTANRHEKHTRLHRSVEIVIIGRLPTTSKTSQRLQQNTAARRVPGGQSSVSALKNPAP